LIANSKLSSPGLAAADLVQSFAQFFAGALDQSGIALE
jgi:hypothetical protein